LLATLKKHNIGNGSGVILSRAARLAKTFAISPEKGAQTLV